jgi:hypothetical protein
MKSLKKTLSIVLEALALIGLIAGLIFAFQFARVNFLPSNGNSRSAYYPLSEATQVSKPFPTHTSYPTWTPTPTPIVLENGWYLYTDPDGEFSFAYPPTALIHAGRNPVDFSTNVALQFILPDKPYQGMLIRLEPNPKRLQGTEIALQLFERSAQKPAPVEFANSLTQISVGGTLAVQAYIPSMNTEVTIIIPYSDKVFIICPEHDTPVTKVEKETLELFYQILDTLKLGDSK